MPEIENNETNVVTENAGMGTNGDLEIMQVVILLLLILIVVG